MQNQTQRLLVLFNLSLYAICYQMLNPVLIDIVSNLSKDASHYGVLKSVFSLVQTLGGLLMGPLTDKYGSKIAMLLSVGGSTLYYFSILNANSLMALYFANIPTFFQHMFLSGQKFFADSVRKEERAKYNGYLGLSYGIGVFIGPKLGGALGKISLHYAPFMSTFISLISFFSIMIFIKDQKKNNKESEKKKHDEIIKKTYFQMFREVFSTSKIRILLMMKASFAIGSGAFFMMLNVFLKERFHLDSSDRGTILSIFGLAGALSQGILTPFVSKFKLNPIYIMTTALFVLFLGYCSLFFAQSFNHLIISVLPLAVGGTLFVNFQSAELSNSVIQEDTGTVLSVDMSLSSAYRIFTPSLGVFILENFGYQSLCCFSAFMMIVSISFQFFHYKIQTNYQKNKLE